MTKQQPLETKDVQNQMELLVKTIKNTSFVSDYSASDQEAIGMIISKYFEWDGLAILEAMGYALEDANFHTENSKVQEMINNLK